ncbi:hypothetical protein FIBSPDRAFT_900486 [Athelia psychrophila]|uniref:Uncharacterized protein n=1 Tax=Athelia psychrophila TaxID=1759441 RepID=A0A165YEC3_9AGAM|nr:hypothetical protein FIBSPDRAFT_900486 [Fibularhizoctonia sp. CBS 109695]
MERINALDQSESQRVHAVANGHGRLRDPRQYQYQYNRGRQRGSASPCQESAIAEGRKDEIKRDTAAASGCWNPLDVIGALGWNRPSGRPISTSAAAWPRVTGLGWKGSALSQLKGIEFEDDNTYALLSQLGRLTRASFSAGQSDVPDVPDMPWSFSAGVSATLRLHALNHSLIAPDRRLRVLLDCRKLSPRSTQARPLVPDGTVEFEEKWLMANASSTAAIPDNLPLRLLCTPSALRADLDMNNVQKDDRDKHIPGQVLDRVHIGSDSKRSA